MDDVWTRSAQHIVLREGASTPLHMLRLRTPQATTLPKVGEALGVTLPVTPNRAHGTTPRAIWMGPGEWMIVEAAGSVEAVEAVSDAAVTLMVSVGDGRYPLNATGAAVRDLLAKAVSIDLHPRIFPIDHSAMTLFAQVPVVIDHVGPDSFRLWFDVSHRHYVRTWLADAMVEFGE